MSTLASIVDQAAYAPEGATPDLPAHAWTTAGETRRRLRARMRVRPASAPSSTLVRFRRRPGQSVADDAG